MVCRSPSGASGLRGAFPSATLCWHRRSHSRPMSIRARSGEPVPIGYGSPGAVLNYIVLLQRSDERSRPLLSKLFAHTACARPSNLNDQNRPLDISQPSLRRARPGGLSIRGMGVVRTPSTSFPAIGAAKPNDPDFALLAIHCAHDVARRAASFAATSRRRDVAL